MNKRWIFSAILFAVASLPLTTAQVARADRDDHDRGRHWEHRDRHWDRDDWRHGHRYYHRDWDRYYYRGPVYDNDRWRIHYRVDPGYRYYDDYYDYRDYYATPWWNGGSFRIDYYNH